MAVGGGKRKNISKHVFLRGTHTERRFLIKSKTSLFSSSVRDKFPRREIQGKEARGGKYIASDKSVFLLPPPPPLRHTEKREKEVKGEGKFCSIVALFSFSLCFSLRAKVNSFETKNQENLMYRIEEFLFFPFFKPDRIYLSKSFFFRTFLSPVFPPPYFMLDWTFYWPRKEDSLTSWRRRRGNLRVRAPGNFLFSCRRPFGIYKTLYPTNWNYTFLRNSQFKRICLLSQTYFVLVIKVVFSLLILRE